MKTFVDNVGQTWSVRINVDAIKRVRDLVEVDLLEVIGGRLLEQLTSDPILLCDVIYSVCKPEADARNVTAEDFGRAMGGDAIEAASDALLAELIDFFPKGRRAVLTTARAKLNQYQAAVMEAVQTRLESPEMDRHFSETLQTLGDWSGSVPASSASIPAPSHSGSLPR